MTLASGPLSLVPAHPGLAEELAAYYRRNREFLRAFEPERTEEFFTASYQKDLLEQEAEACRRKTGYRFYLRHQDRPGQLVGSIGLSNVVWGAFYSCFLGYKLDEGLLNLGYMTTAVGLVVDYAFHTLGLHRVEANVMPRNRRSLRVLEKNGFQTEGLSKCYLNINGIWEDHIHMVKLNAQWHGETPGGTCGARQ